jgi:hypothetical protein
LFSNICTGEDGNDNIQPVVIQIIGYKAEAVKILMDWIKGYELLMSACEDIQILTDMLKFCDYYDIPR